MNRDAVVYLIDNDPDALRSLRWLLKSEGMQVQTYRSAHDFLKSYHHGKPGCLVLDLSLPEIDGLELQQRLISRGEQLPIIFVTGQGDVSKCARAMKAGAVDFLEKPPDAAALLQLVCHAIAAHKTRCRWETDKREIQSRLDRLTPRERDVMHLLFDGKAPKNIAAELGIGIQTVSKHRAHVLEKMEVGGEAELARLLVRCLSDVSWGRGSNVRVDGTIPLCS